MKLNRKLVPIKAHFFFFMCAMGPILPQLFVYGKEMGISSVAMGGVTGILPFLFLLAKPLFGMVVDVYRDFRKTIFIALIIFMTTSFALLALIPQRVLLKFETTMDKTHMDLCNETEIEELNMCKNETISITCTSECSQDPFNFLLTNFTKIDDDFRLCTQNTNKTINLNSTCDLKCVEDIESNNGCLYKSWPFWMFVIFMSFGSIGFNVVNSISDAICFDVIGDEYDYGKQRVWGTIGFGLTALIAGYIVDLFSDTKISYMPALIVMIVCSCLDLVACYKLNLPVIKGPENIIKEFIVLLKNKRVFTFMIFAICAGILDSLIIYFLFWYVEDLALKTNTTNIKLLEGLIVAAETLGGEVIFFSISGKILSKFGHVHCFSMCFINYALRLSLISIASSPWWIVPIEFCFQGPTYALTYTTIVAYANELAPPGASATMQGIAAGMDDGVGFAVGSFIGGILFQYIGGQKTLQVFSVFGVMCSIVHLVLHKTVLATGKSETKEDDCKYKSPQEALMVTYQN
ncbi:unnamed protein product [Brassicogethes aeneus]|uniref:Major facilitator superfamily associated domain-containing protein n=1 Tax=Brassicogethes aeneus TaxID=1431903 RepID=A0A9P0B766_BRAAE|nr:unnamed protein product [Brassicogethes aeneus]